MSAATSVVTSPSTCTRAIIDARSDRFAHSTDSSHETSIARLDHALSRACPRRREAELRRLAAPSCP